MIFEIFLAIFLGCFAGIITGLFPGIHINLVSVGLIGISSLVLKIFTPITVVSFIIAMAITHTFLDSIPSIFFGAPDAETALSVLPGHKLLLHGRGYEAVFLTLVGSSLALIITILISPLFIYLIKNFYSVIEKTIPFILIASSTYLIFSDTKSKIWSLTIFLLSGILGVITLNLASIKEPLFPLFSGLFGISTLVTSMFEKTKIPIQQIGKIKINKLQVKRAISTSVVVGSFCSLLPGMGPAQAAVIGSQIMKKIEDKSFLILIGGLNTLNIVLSIFTLYVLNKSRNGAIIAVSKLLNETLTLNHLLIFIGVCLISGSFAIILTIHIAKKVSKRINKINYHKLCTIIILTISIMTLFISGTIGFFVLLISSFLGITTILLGIKRSHMMGCLMIPIIIYFI